LFPKSNLTPKIDDKMTNTCQMMGARYQITTELAQALMFYILYLAEDGCHGDADKLDDNTLALGLSPVVSRMCEFMEDQEYIDGVLKSENASFTKFSFGKDDEE